MFDVEEKINRMLGKNISKDNLSKNQQKDKLIVTFDDGNVAIYKTWPASKSLLRENIEQSTGKKIKSLRWSWEK